MQLVADALTGAGLEAASASPRQRDAIFLRLYDAVWTYDASGDPSALKPFVEKVNVGLPAGKEERRPLHWPLVFPEIFADTTQAGLAAAVGNPPFLGGKKISASAGDDYLAWLATWDGRGLRGNTDLAVRFLLRADALLHRNGQLGFVTTNSVIEGENLTVGLLQLESRGWTVRRGVSTHSWPSSTASLSIIELWASKASVRANAVLDGEAVPRLSVDLQPFLRETGRPVALRENDGLAFQGHNVLGTGFTLSPDEADRLVRDDPRNAEVLLPYINGADVNRRPDASGSRWIVNFREWPEERARTYAGSWAKLESDVRPGRASKDAAKYPRMVHEWWKFWQYRQGLELAIANLASVVCLPRVANTLMPVMLPRAAVFSDQCVIFALDDFGSLAQLSSCAHQVWTLRYTSTIGVGAGIRYAPSDIFASWPRPRVTSRLTALGEQLHRERGVLLTGRSVGLTKLYNAVNDPTVTDPAIRTLRAIHAEIDDSMMSAYGWGDLKLGIGHHLTKIGIRWTVSPTARFELLDRLLVENHRRAGLQQ